jgi:hypothetical protein
VKIFNLHHLGPQNVLPPGFPMNLKSAAVVIYTAFHNALLPAKTEGKEAHTGRSKNCYCCFIPVARNSALWSHLGVSCLWALIACAVFYEVFPIALSRSHVAPVERVWLHKWNDYGLPREAESFHTCFFVDCWNGLRGMYSKFLDTLQNNQQVLKKDTLIRRVAEF